LVIFVFIIAEIGYRLYKEGFPDAFIHLIKNWRTPYSDFGTNNLFIYDEELGYRLNPERPDINELSIRSNDFSVKKPEGVYRMACLGDSLLYAFKGKIYEGNSVDNPSIRMLVEVINAATPGYTTYQELIFLKKYLLQVSPDVVILNYCLNDNHRFLHRFKGDMIWTDEAQESLAINNLFDKIVSRSYVLSRIKLFLVSKKAAKSKSKFPWEDDIGFNTAWKDYSWVDIDRYLGEMSRLLNERGIHLCVVVYPIKLQFKEKLLDSHYDYVLKPQRKMRDICDGYKIPVLDLFPYFYEAYRKGVKLFRPDGLHLTNEALRLVEKSLFSFLEKEEDYLPIKINAENSHF